MYLPSRQLHFPVSLSHWKSCDPFSLQLQGEQDPGCPSGISGLPQWLARHSLQRRPPKPPLQNVWSLTQFQSPITYLIFSSNKKSRLSNDKNWRQQCTVRSLRNINKPSRQRTFILTLVQATTAIVDTVIVESTTIVEQKTLTTQFYLLLVESPL